MDYRIRGIHTRLTFVDTMRLPSAAVLCLLCVPLLRVRASYTANVAAKFVGAQHWNESGWYADKGLLQHYDGFFCLCSCEGK